MCGIAGILGQASVENRAALQRMADAMCHRGPDAHGTWTGSADSDGLTCMLSHRRLSILDLTPAATQPMVDPVTGEIIVFNGEIYNYKNLRKSLESAGQRFDSTGDTAVLLRMIGLEGPAALSRLGGMFAFAVWDEKSRRLMLARDPLGIKPLYLARNPDRRGDWTLVFASEVRAILASGLLPHPRLDPDAVASVVWNGFVMGPGTAVIGVESLWPGQYRVYDARARETAAEFFWSLPRNLARSAPTEIEAPHVHEGMQPRSSGTLQDALEDSVRRHLVSDVPLGVFLSSGVDSSAVANLAQRCSQTPINTFTLAFEEQEYNEAPIASAIASVIGTQHHEILLTEQRFVDNLERAIDSLDQPTFDGLNSWFMSQAVRQAGLTVALVGTGGDELFGGYKSFRELPALRRLGAGSVIVPRAARRAAARALSTVLTGTGGSVSPQTRWAKLPDMLDAGADLLGLYQLAYALFLPDFQRDLLGGMNGALTFGLPRLMQQRLRQEIAGRSALSAISVLEQRCFLGERLLRDTDAASMNVSLEVRLPLVDARLLEAVYRLPDRVRYRPVGRKQLLRDAALNNLDPALFDRPKRGFVLPFDKWIRRHLGQTMDQTMRDEKLARDVGLNGQAVAQLWKAFQDDAPGMYWSRAWALYVLIRWCHRHGVLL